MCKSILTIAFTLVLGLAALQAQAPTPAAPPPPPPPPPLPGIGGPVGLPTPKIEYDFIGKPTGKDAFKKLLKDKAKDGWEYVGLIPDGDELVFKRVQTGGLLGGPIAPGGLAAPPGISGPPAPGLTPPKPPEVSRTPPKE